MIPKGKYLDLLSNSLNLCTEDIWRSVRRICMRILGLKKLNCLPVGFIITGFISPPHKPT